MADDSMADDSMVDDSMPVVGDGAVDDDNGNWTDDSDDDIEMLVRPSDDDDDGGGDGGGIIPHLQTTPDAEPTVPGAFQELVAGPTVPSVAGPSRREPEDREPDSRIYKRRAVSREDAVPSAAPRRIRQALDERDYAVQRGKDMSRKRQKEIEELQKQVKEGTAKMAELEKKANAWGANTAAKYKEMVAEVEAEKNREIAARDKELAAVQAAHKATMAKHKEGHSPTYKAEFDTRLAAFMVRNGTSGPPPQSIEPNFPNDPPAMVPQYISQTTRDNRLLEATMMDKGIRLPALNLDPAAASNAESSNAGTTEPSPVTLDLNDPRFLSLIEQALKKLGAEKMSVETRKPRRANRYDAAKRATQQRITKEDHTHWKALCREVMRVTTGITRARDYVTYEPASDEEKKACDDGTSAPKGHSKFYFGPGYLRSDWNRGIIRHCVATAQTKRLQDDNRWAVPDVSEDYIFSVFCTILAGYQQTWRRWQPHLTETIEEAEERADAWEARRRDATVITSRKRSKYHSRKNTIEKMIKIEVRQGHHKNAQNWEFLLEALKHLGVQGMSTEEESQEELTVGHRTAIFTVHIIRVSAWRNEKITEYMTWVDQTTERGRIKTTAARPRIRLDEASKSAAPPGLPMSLYSKEWLDDERKYDEDIEETLEISSEQFKILELVALNMATTWGLSSEYALWILKFQKLARLVRRTAFATFQRKLPEVNPRVLRVAEFGSLPGSFPQAERSCPTVPSAHALTGHYRAEGNLYTVYMGSRDLVLNSPVPKDARSIEFDDRNPDFRTPNYISPHNPWHGLLLGILDYTFNNLPIVEESPESWSLDRAVAEEWMDFENCLRSVGREMHHLSSKPLPKQMAPWFIPGRYHYFLHYKTERGARLAAWRCRNKFLPLLGYVSMGFWLMMHEELEEAEGMLGVGPGSKRKRRTSPSSVPSRGLGQETQGMVDQKARREPYPLAAGVSGKAQYPGVVARYARESSDFDHLVIGPYERTGMEWLFDSILRSGCPIPLYFSWGRLPRYIDYAVPKYLQDLGLMPTETEIDYIAHLPGPVAFSPLTQDHDTRFYRLRL
ncbi:hypothetical protein B0H12DRAFT_1081823, partial [Mycena haematopus]